jgi:hypothetical protein
VRPEGADHKWRERPLRGLSIDLVAGERSGRVTGRAELRAPVRLNRRNPGQRQRACFCSIGGGGSLLRQSSGVRIDSGAPIIVCRGCGGQIHCRIQSRHVGYGARHTPGSPTGSSCVGNAPLLPILTVAHIPTFAAAQRLLPPDKGSRWAALTRQPMTKSSVRCRYTVAVSDERGTLSVYINPLGS